MTYQIKVLGKLDGQWSTYFSDMVITWARQGDGQTVTTLTVPVADQAALRGILNKIWDLNLVLISVTRSNINDHS